MNPEVLDMDPLNYGYGYNYDIPITNNSYSVKAEPASQPIFNPIQSCNAYQETQVTNTTDQMSTEPNSVSETSNVAQEEIDSKEELKPLIAANNKNNKKRKGKSKGKTSSYWNKKISDTNFAFYGCTICNVSFAQIAELDKHVIVHKGRLTSYDIRLQNQKKKKILKKQAKKLKKLGKRSKKEVKKEEPLLDFEIKPEDGYIGNEKASEVNQENTEPIGENNTGNIDNKIGNNAKSIATAVDTNKSSDPRLSKLFKCFACQKQFSLSYYLKLHVRSHTDEKPYTCSVCGQSFITASKLGRHNKRIHLAVKHQCRICFRMFSRFELLTRHFDKKHEEDKLEGEPYDFNAILPYLKELEDQLCNKTEDMKEEKPKPAALWPDGNGAVQLQQSMANPDQKLDGGDQKLEDCEQKSDDGDQKVYKIKEEFVTTLSVNIEEFNDENKIKKEEVEDGSENANGEEDGFRDDSFSDEDYFPSNTWAATPKPEPPSPPARPAKTHYPAKCDLCDKLISTRTYMKIHLRTHTGERPYKCYVCNRGFITSSKMHRHVLTHTEVFEDGKDEIKLEGATKEETEKRKEVGAKKKRNKVQKKLSPKVKGSKEKRRPHMCPYCHKRFLHNETLQVHMKSHKDEPLVLKCTFCLEEMADEVAKSEHELSHTGPKPYHCTICGRNYKKRESMIYHRKTHSSDAVQKRKEFICDICSKTFNAQCKLQRHIVAHGGEKFVLRYECPVCAHMFNTIYHIQMHLATHQKEGLILEENRNEILAMVLQNARKIPKRVEGGVGGGGGVAGGGGGGGVVSGDERSRVCNICGQVFQHFFFLEEHLKSHGSKIAVDDLNQEEEKKHICPICNKGFKLHYYLKLHSFTHSKEKPFICQQCGKGFITKGKLKRHLETHSGLKKYQCHVCYKFFTRPSYLRIHVRTIHGTQDYNFRLDSQFLSPLSQ